jgi:hypothetical protein
MKKKSHQLKKIVIVAFLTICSITKVQAQAALLVLIFGEKAATENFNFSIIAGLNSSNIQSINSSKRYNDINFGLGINWKINEKVYFKPEFRAISPRGSNGTFSLNTGIPAVDSSFSNVSTSTRSNYIDVPLLLYYQVGKRLQLGAGPQVSYLMSSKQTYTGGEKNTFIQNVESELNPWDYGLVGTLTYQFSTKRNGKGMNIQLRYYQGLNDVYKTVNNSTAGIWSLNLEFPFISGDEAK